MKQAKEYIGYFLAMVTLCGWLFTYYVKKQEIEFVKAGIEEHEAELQTIHEKELEEVKWRTKMETTVDLITRRVLE